VQSVKKRFIIDTFGWPIDESAIQGKRKRYLYEREDEIL
jgi:hypothetical protein